MCQALRSCAEGLRLQDRTPTLTRSEGKGRPRKPHNKCMAIDKATSMAHVDTNSVQTARELGEQKAPVIASAFGAV